MGVMCVFNSILIPLMLIQPISSFISFLRCVIRFPRRPSPLQADASSRVMEMCNSMGVVGNE